MAFDKAAWLANRKKKKPVEGNELERPFPTPPEEEKKGFDREAFLKMRREGKSRSRSHENERD